MKSCCDEFCANHGCHQGRSCPVRTTMAEMGEPYKFSNLDMAIAVVIVVFTLSCIGYLIGGIR